jgi:hypothetical protein
MVTNSTSRLNATRATSRIESAAIFTRLPLAVLSIVLTLIALRYLVDPVGAAREAGIVFTSPGGITVARVGFAAFPLGFVGLFLSCIFSARKVLTGLRTELMLLGIVIAVRMLGMGLAHSSETGKLLVPEAVMAALCIAAIRVELHRRKTAS